jgi:hypothetical protein
MGSLNIGEHILSFIELHVEVSNFSRSSKLELCHNVSKPYEPSSKVS